MARLSLLTAKQFRHRACQQAEELPDGDMLQFDADQHVERPISHQGLGLGLGQLADSEVPRLPRPPPETAPTSSILLGEEFTSPQATLRADRLKTN